ncbi:hypothetical protein HJC23_006553 [Cyclotella cryptica]|uniref:RING-type domain-containing protein n=1 Tax=Cyclotella cryptica TaxID=29204 RepID=A0ABD3PJY9_9STRA|eukprot:CCRYP_013632-RA/>CCRYP_013632-RA protein AED:0.05 eAED:0.05 QI:0/-1/0/1/-1/1/1/0/863
MSSEPRRNNQGRGRGGRGRGGRSSNNSNSNSNSNNISNINRDNSNAFNFAGRGPKQFSAPRPEQDRSQPRPAFVIPRHETLDLLQSDDTPQSPTHKSVVPDDVQDHQHCLVCYSSQLRRHRALSPCGHDDICAPCTLRLRYLHNDLKCVVCKTVNETVIVTDRDGVKYADFNSWGDDLGGDYVYREECGMHFPKEYYQSVVLPLFGYQCGMPGCDFDESEVFVTEGEEKGDDDTNIGGDSKNKKKKAPARQVKKRLTNLDALKNHLRTTHGMTLCDLCITNKRDFVSKLGRFTPTGIKTHLTKGDGDTSGFTGHPLCEFCRPLRFYDIVKLHEHLNKEHYKCHICDKMGKPNQFFKDYARLETHFDRDHFLCHDKQCLDARFVVFENEIDLRAHEASVHGVRNRDGNTKIKLEFRVRREGEHLQQQVPTGDDFQYGLNGEAFVPDALPGEEQQRQMNEPDISDPIHAARTAELRAMAAQIRERNGMGGGAEAFPALGGRAGASSDGTGLLVGWTSAGSATAASAGSRLKKTPVGKVTDEEFPSLGGGTNASTNRYAALGLGKKNNVQRTLPAGVNFSAVAARTASSSSSRPVPSSSKPISTVSYASSMPISRPPDMTRDNFPSLGLVTRPAAQPFVPTISSSRAPSMHADNFPSLGGASSSNKNGTSSTHQNPYAAAQALSRKLKAGKAPGSAPTSSPIPSLSNSADFPPPPTAASKRPSVATALASKKPPPIDNILQFPPPPTSTSVASSNSAKKQPSKPSPESLKSGMSTVELLKEKLGSVRYKKLKSLTKSFAMGSTNPEEYVDQSAALFDRGLADKVFWSHVPDLIVSCPNTDGVNRALQYLESVRLANEMQELEFGGR